MKILRIASVVVAVGLLAGCASGANPDANGGTDDKVLRIGATGQSWPNAFQEDGKLTGYDVEIAQLVAGNLGYDIEWTTTDFSGLMGQLESGKLDTVANNVAITDEREEVYTFTTPYAVVGAQIVTSTKNTDINSLKDLEGKTISGVLGSNNLKNLAKYDPEGKIKVQTYETRDGAMLDAINGRVDGYINSKPVLLAEIKKEDLPLKMVGDPINYEKVGFPFAKDDTGTQLAKDFSAEIEKLKADGTIADLGVKYFGEDISVEKG